MAVGISTETSVARNAPVVADFITNIVVDLPRTRTSEERDNREGQRNRRRRRCAGIKLAARLLETFNRYEFYSAEHDGHR